MDITALRWRILDVFFRNDSNAGSKVSQSQSAANDGFVLPLLGIDAVAGGPDCLRDYVTAMSSLFPMAGSAVLSCYPGTRGLSGAVKRSMVDCGWLA